MLRKTLNFFGFLNLHLLQQGHQNNICMSLTYCKQVRWFIAVFVLGSTPAQWRFTEGWIADKTDKQLTVPPAT